MNNNRFFEVDLFALLHALRRCILWIVLAAAASALVGFCIARFAIAPSYESGAVLYVDNSSSSSSKDNVSAADLSASKSLTGTYSVLLQSRETLEEIIRLCHVNYTYKELAKRLTASSVNNTEVLRIVAVGSSPAEAASIAEAAVQVLPRRIASIVDGCSVRVVDHATEPMHRSSPSYIKFTLWGSILGLLLACAWLMLSEIAHSKIYDARQLLQEYPDIPLLSTLPSNAGKEHTSTFQESITLLRTNLLHALSCSSDCPAIGVISTLPREGKSVVSVHLAQALAQTGKKVLLIDGNIRNPSLAESLSVKSVPGLSDVLLNICPIEDAVQDSSLSENLKLLCAGDSHSCSSELLSSPQFSHILETLRPRFDFIIVDIPALSVTTDSLLISKSLQGVILTVRRDYCTERDLFDAVQQLNYLSIRILGFTLLCSPPAKPSLPLKTSHTSLPGKSLQYR